MTLGRIAAWLVDAYGIARGCLPCRFDGLRRWLREEGRDAPAELRAMIEDTILGFGVGL